MTSRNKPAGSRATNRSRLVLVFWDHAVDAVWMEQSWLGPSLRLMVRLPRDDQFPAALGQRLRESGTTPSRVLVCLPRKMAIQRTLSFPLAVRDDLAQMLQFEAARHVPLQDSDRRLAYASAPQPDGKQLGVHLLAARKSDLELFLSPLTAAGVPVDEVTTLNALLIPSGTEGAVLQILSDEEHIEVILFQHGLPQESLVLPKPAGTAGKDELVDTVRRLIARHHGQLGAEGVGRLICAGPSALPEDTLNSLGMALGLHAQTMEIPERLRPAVPRGAAILTETLCAAARVMPPELNLIDQSSRKVPWSRRKVIITALSTLLVAELIAGSALYAMAPAKALKKTEQEGAELNRRAAPVLAVKNQNRELRNELKQLNQLAEQHISVMGLLKTISDALPDDTYVLSLEYIRGDQIRLRGRSKAPDRLPDLLQAIPVIKTIEEWDIGEKDDDYFGFRFTAALRSDRNE